MIFVIVGSQKFPFDRLIREMDRLKAANVITEQVFAQIGASTYIPQHLIWKRYLDKEEFDAQIDASDILITHAGEGSIMTGLLKHKKVIAVPRYKNLGEHVSDHQLEIARALAKQKCIVNVEDITQLESAICHINEFDLQPYESGNDSILQLLCDFIGE